jgi:hypothetical protein
MAETEVHVVQAKPKASAWLLISVGVMSMGSIFWGYA